MGVTHIVIHPTSRLVGLSMLSITSGIIAICPRAAARRFSRQMQPHFPAHHAAAPPSRRPRRGPLAAPDWLCSGRQWPQPLLLLPPARGPYGWTPRAAAGAVAVE
eukprot:COSAG01_NODE_21612_length_893_cov_5.595718_1_plen_104_part_10